jgi:hypothetical protein
MQDAMAFDSVADARQFLDMAETLVRAAPGARIALKYIGTASFRLYTWSDADVARGLRVVDAHVGLGGELTIDDISRLHGHYSNLGDACGAHLVPHVHVPPNVLVDTNVVELVGPQTLRALLRAGADPGGTGPPVTPLAQAVYRARGVAKFRVQKVALLLAAGADPASVTPDADLAEVFQCARDLRALSAFCGAASLDRADAPAAWFVTRDGDSAIAHRVQGFIGSLER